ncbi:hypothetical protein Tco_0976282 [Tanacetum coccineum]|uniref:Uncharacterized protein n=1 Tax=Tanacetum coccineum TaxID=301880 RepID=A0ABQ5EGT3_9ASTR
MASTALGHDQPAVPSEDVEEREEEEVPLRRKRSAYRRARTEFSTPAFEQFQANLSCWCSSSHAKDAQARKRFEEEQASERLVQRLRAEDLAQEDLPNVSEERAKELDDLMMRMTETDWLTLMMQVGSNPALARELLGADVNEENFIERMNAVKEKKKRALADLRYRALKGKPMKKSELIEEYEYICRRLEKDRLLSAQYNLFRPKPAITEPPSKRQRVERVSSQPASVPATTTHTADPDSAGGGSSNLAGSATPMAASAASNPAGGTFGATDSLRVLHLSSTSIAGGNLHVPMYYCQLQGCPLNPPSGVLMSFSLEKVDEGRGRLLPDDKIVDPRVKVENRFLSMHLLLLGLGSESESDDDMENYIPPLPYGEFKDWEMSLHSDDLEDFWRTQDDWIVSSWKLYPKSSVHVLDLTNGKTVYMFVDKFYPIRATLLEHWKLLFYEVATHLIAVHRVHAVSICCAVLDELLDFVALPATNQAPFAEETKPFEIDESTTTLPPHPAYRVIARISIPAPIPTPVWSDAEVARLLAISTPPSSPLSPWSSPLPHIPSSSLPLSPPLHVLSPAPPPSPIRSLGYQAVMIRIRAEAASTSYYLPLPPPFILSPTRPNASSLGIPPPLPISVPTSSPPLLLPSASRREDRPEVTLPPWKRLGIALGPGYEVGEISSVAAARPAGGLRADYGFVATMDKEIRHDSEREVRYEITDLWDEIVENLQGAPVSIDTELGRHMTAFETRVRQDMDEVYTRLDDEQSQRQLLAGRLNKLFRDG